MKKIAGTTGFNIVSLNISFKGMNARSDRTRSLTVRLNRSISGSCSSLDHNLGICQDQPYILVEVQTRYQHVYEKF